MNKVFYRVIILMAISIQPLSANQAIQSAPLLASHYHCLINNASNTHVKLQYIQFRNLKGNNVENTVTTCKKDNNLISLAPGEGCFATYINKGLALPVYCRVQHYGKQGYILGVLQQHPTTGSASTMLTPVRYKTSLHQEAIIKNSRVFNNKK